MYKSASKYSFGIRFLCIIGFLLSIYSLYVKNSIAEDSSYEAICDISERVKCSKIFDSKYGSGFGIIGPLFGNDTIFNQPNGVLGIVFYTTVLYLDCTNLIPLIELQTVLSVFSNFVSIYLAFLLYFVFENFCIICATLYIVNFLLFLLSLRKCKALARILQSKKNK